jgi:hypothetical protein
MTGRARGFSEDERAKDGGEGSLLPSSTKKCLKVLSRETSSFSLRYGTSLRINLKWGQ